MRMFTAAMLTALLVSATGAAATAASGDMLFAQRAAADWEGQGFFLMVGLNAGGALNVRAQPSADSQRVGSIPDGANRIENLGCQLGLSVSEWQERSESERIALLSERWCRVRYEGVPGWVSSRFLVESGGEDAL